MWITKDGHSKDFFNPVDLREYLDSFSSQSMDTSCPHTVTTTDRPSALPSLEALVMEQRGRTEGKKWNRNNDINRRSHPQKDRDTALLAATKITQDNSRDKSRSPLKAGAPEG